MTLLRMIAAIALLGSVTWVHAQTMSGADFAATAASSDMLEIRASELALQNSKDAAVKELRR